MKKYLLLTAVSMLAFGVSDVYAATAQGTAKAEILTAGQITPGENLDFGRMLNTSSHTVTVTVDGERSSTADSMLVGGTTEGKAGTFAIKGTKNSAITVNVPETISLAGVNGGNLTVKNIMWKLGNITGTGGVSGQGTLTGTTDADDDTAVINTLFVGGSMDVTSGQEGGVYTGTYTVEVTY